MRAFVICGVMVSVVFACEGCALLRYPLATCDGGERRPLNVGRWDTSDRANLGGRDLGDLDLGGLNLGSLGVDAPVPGGSHLGVTRAADIGAPHHKSCGGHSHGNG